jgi:acetylornithine deacetylase/succinyl-diaminopimelate desuccinylase-like protein
VLHYSLNLHLVKKIRNPESYVFVASVLQFKQKGCVLDNSGKPAMTPVDSSNPWWSVFEEAVKKAGGKLGKPEVFPASTDARYFRKVGIPALGFSPIANTPVLLHDHNEVCLIYLDWIN